MATDELEIERREAAVKVDKLADALDNMTDVVKDLRESDQDG